MRIQNTSWRGNVRENLQTLHTVPVASIPACTAQESPSSHVVVCNIPIHNGAGSLLHSEVPKAPCKMARTTPEMHVFCEPTTHSEEMHQRKIKAPTHLARRGPVVCPGRQPRGHPPLPTTPPGPTGGNLLRGEVGGGGACKLSLSCAPLTNTQNSDKEARHPTKLLEPGKKSCTMQKTSIGIPKDITMQLKSKKKYSYDMCFVEKWDRIWSRIEHRQDDAPDNMPIDSDKHTRTRLICMRHFKTSVLSYSFYRDISKRFPVLMRERNIKRYYHRLLQTY